MIKSMTGFGQATFHQGDLSISVEIKSLNSKFLDLTLRLPKRFSDKELEVRNLITEKLDRGKVSFSIDHQLTGKTEVRQTYNQDLFVAYYQELRKLADRVVAPSYDAIFSLALNSPEVIQSNGKDVPEPAEWEQVQRVMAEALSQFEMFRVSEGSVLEEKLKAYIGMIGSYLTAVEKLDPKRIERIRERIQKGVAAFFQEEGFDSNRLEQEILFYIEKLDIHEERVRLKTHLDYFINVLHEKTSSGKKLGFIAQEIGREINTMGAKANDSDIQRQVILMKEELEKIKEQLNNVL
jgi:uncharacterized protein (TIGR00255 family)